MTQLLLLLLVLLLPMEVGAAPPNVDTTVELEELALRLVQDDLTPDDDLLIDSLSSDELETLNDLIEETALEHGIFFSLEEDGEEILIISAPRFPQTNGCERILNYREQGYTYHIPYSSWFKDEGWRDDLMLEYAHWTNDGRQRKKAFYISDPGLFNAMRNCGVAVDWEAMEGNKQRVTAVVGWGIWAFYGATRVIYNTYLGFAP